MVAHRRFLGVGGALARTVVACVIAAGLLSVVGCSAPGNMEHPTAVPSGGSPTSSPSALASASPGLPETSTDIRLLGPDAPVEIDGNPVAVVVEVLAKGKKTAGLPVTFTVESGPAHFPAGFEATMTDETGVAVATTLESSKAGIVTLRVTSGEQTALVKVTLLGPRR